MQSRRTDQNGLTTPKGRSDVLADDADRSVSRDAVARDDPDHSPAIRPSSVAVAKSTQGASGCSESSRLWLRRTDQLLLGVLLITLLVLLVAFRWKLSGGGRDEIEIISQSPIEYFYSIDINNASWVEWAQLDGIGEKLARRIVQDRIDRGPFNSVDDILRVHGIGPKLLDKLRPFLKCNNEQASPVTEKPNRKR